jgi:ribulose kinase
MKSIKILFLFCTSALFMIACTKNCECTITETYTHHIGEGMIGNWSDAISSEVWKKQKDKSCKQMGEEAYIQSIDSIQRTAYTKEVICK